MTMVLTYTVVDHGNRPLWFPMLDRTWAALCHGHFEYGRGVACKIVRQKVSRDTWAADLDSRVARGIAEDEQKKAKEMLDGAGGTR